VREAPTCRRLSPVEPTRGSWSAPVPNRSFGTEPGGSTGGRVPPRLRSVLDACADPILARPTHEASAVTFPKAGNVNVPLRLVYAISEARARAVQGVVPAAVGLSGVLEAAAACAAVDDTTDCAQLHQQEGWSMRLRPTIACGATPPGLRRDCPSRSRDGDRQTRVGAHEEQLGHHSATPNSSPHSRKCR
jgi:hypothetical protein